MTFSTLPYTSKIVHNMLSHVCSYQEVTHKGEFIGDCLDSTRDVIIQSRVARLEHGCIVLLAPNEDISGVHLTYIKYGMNGNFD